MSIVLSGFRGLMTAIGMIILCALALISWIWEKIGTLGMVIALYAFSALCILLLDGCVGVNDDSSNNTQATEEANMSTIRFFWFSEDVLPAAPGAIDSPWLGVVPLAWAGIVNPMYFEPEHSTATPTVGCSTEGNVVIKRYRYYFQGVQGILPGLKTGGPGIHLLSHFDVGFGRGEYGTGVLLARSFSLGQPYEWNEVNEVLEIQPLTTPLIRPKFSASDITLDTRNLAAVYYGVNVRFVFEVDVECVPVGF